MGPWVDGGGGLLVQVEDDSDSPTSSSGNESLGSSDQDSIVEISDDDDPFLRDEHDYDSLKQKSTLSRPRRIAQDLLWAICCLLTVKENRSVSPDAERKYRQDEHGLWEALLGSTKRLEAIISADKEKDIGAEVVRHCLGVVYFLVEVQLLPEIVTRAQRAKLGKLDAKASIVFTKTWKSIRDRLPRSSYAGPAEVMQETLLATSPVILFTIAKCALTGSGSISLERTVLHRHSTGFEKTPVHILHRHSIEPESWNTEMVEKADYTTLMGICHLDPLKVTQLSLRDPLWKEHFPYIVPFPFRCLGGIFPLTQGYKYLPLFLLRLSLTHCPLAEQSDSERVILIPPFVDLRERWRRDAAAGLHRGPPSLRHIVLRHLVKTRVPINPEWPLSTSLRDALKTGYLCEICSRPQVNDHYDYIHGIQNFGWDAYPGPIPVKMQGRLCAKCLRALNIVGKGDVKAQRWRRNEMEEVWRFDVRI